MDVDLQTASSTATPQRTNPSRPAFVSLICFLEFSLVGLFLLVQFIPQLGKVAADTYISMYGKPTLTMWLMAVLDMSLRAGFAVGYWKMKRWGVLLNGVSLLIMFPYTLVTHFPQDFV